MFSFSLPQILQIIFQTKIKYPETLLQAVKGFSNLWLKMLYRKLRWRYERWCWNNALEQDHLWPTLDWNICYLSSASLETKLRPPGRQSSTTISYPANRPGEFMFLFSVSISRIENAIQSNMFNAVEKLEILKYALKLPHAIL